MQEIIKKGHDYRIIPENFESATIFELMDVDKDDLKIELVKAQDSELKDYAEGTSVEIFGSGSDGLIFFETKVKQQEGRVLLVGIPENYKNIQRREYSRVKFMGDIDLEGENDNIIRVEDISAGGMKIITKRPLDAEKNYKLNINLINNLSVGCFLHPIRIEEQRNPDGTLCYAISGRYKDISSIDRIALVQYSFKVLMEAENKQNDR